VDFRERDRVQPWHHLGSLAVGGTGQAQLTDQPVPEGAPQPLDAALRLRCASSDRVDAQLLECPSELGRRAPVDELLLQRQRRGRGFEDGVPVAIDGQWDAVATDGLAQHHQIAQCVLLLAEGGAGDDARGVIDRADQAEPRAATLEPVVAAAVELDEQAGLGHPIAPAAMARRTSTVRTGQARRAQDAPHGDPARVKRLEPRWYGRRPGQDRLAVSGAATAVMLYQTTRPSPNA